MTEEAPLFPGFPGIGQATAIPNLFFAAVLPRMRQPGELLSFLWVANLVQAQREGARFVTEDDVWNAEGAPDAFAALAGGREGLSSGLKGCVRLGALVALRVVASGSPVDLYFVNNAASRRAIARARAGELRLLPGAIVEAPPAEPRPGIWRLYEENVGTITPLVGERLIAAADNYPPGWIEDAFREAAERNIRSWRYIERILERWAQEGRSDEGAQGDTFEDRKRRYVGQGLGISRTR